jgi:uroporphyrinogen-III synthase
MGALDGKTIGVTEWRMAKELAAMLEKHGATVTVCPLVEQQAVTSDDGVAGFIARVIAGELDVMIFLTGIGARSLAAAADAQGKKDELLSALARTQIVVRGPKPVAALRQLGVRIDVVPDEPTTEGVIAAVKKLELGGKTVGVQLYAVPNPVLRQALETMRAKVLEVSPYEYHLGSDESAVLEFIKRIAEGAFDAVTFTSAPQAKMLFSVASQAGLADDLRQALNDKTVVAAIGPVAEKALNEFGVTAEIKPDRFVMGALVKAVVEYFTAASGGAAV